MGNVGRWITDPRAGAYCTITRLTIERLKLFGFSSERIFDCDLERQQGKTALSFLTRDAHAKSLDATPLGAFVKYPRSCRSIGEVKARCASLMAIQ